MHCALLARQSLWFLKWMYHTGSKAFKRRLACNIAVAIALLQL